MSIFIPVEDRKTKTNAAILAAKSKITTEIRELKEKLKSSKEAISKFKEEIAKVEGGTTTAATPTKQPPQA